MKIKEILEKSIEVIANTPKFDFASIINLKKENIGVSFVDIEDGKSVLKYWCPHCKTVSLHPGSKLDVCANCGEHITATSAYATCIRSSAGPRARVLYVCQEFVLIEALPSSYATWNNPTGFTDIEEAYKNSTVIVSAYYAPEYYVFGKEIGLRKISSTFSQMQKTVPVFKYRYPFIVNELLDGYKEYMSTVIGHSKDDYGTYLDIDFSHATGYKVPVSGKAAAVAKARATRAKKKEAEDEIARNLLGEDVEKSIANKILGFSDAYMHSNTEYAYWCPVCGHHEVRELSNIEAEQNQLICTACGQPIKIVKKTTSDARCRKNFIRLASDGNNLAMILYEGYATYNTHTKKIEKSAKLICEQVFFEKKIVEYDGAGNRDEYRPRSIPRFLDPSASYEEEKEVLENTRWGKFGIGIIHDIYIRNNEQNDYDELSEFIDTFQKAPIVEQLLKCGCTNLYRWVRNNASCPSDFCKFNATNIRDGFNLTKTQAKLVIDNNLTYAEMRHLKHLQEVDASCTFEDYNWSNMTYPCDSSGCNSVLDAVIKSKATVSEVRKYLTSCHYDQCIDWPEITSLWIDYLMMMDKLKFSPEERKKEMFPRSLKKAHDVLNFAARNIYDKEKAMLFDENVTEAKKFEYSFNNYLVKAPDAAEDLVKEGIALNHSVGQHIEYVADGKEYILFIRAKSNPDEPLYTVELLKGEKEIVQVRGNSNRLVKDPEVLEFIQKWAKFKKLSIKAF